VRFVDRAKMTIAEVIDFIEVTIRKFSFFRQKYAHPGEAVDRIALV
jgi:hypothetical protein